MEMDLNDGRLVHLLMLTGMEPSGRKTIEACVRGASFTVMFTEPLAVCSPCWVITSIVYVPFGSMPSIVWPPLLAQRVSRPSVAFERDRDRSRLNIRKGDFDRIVRLKNR